MVESIPRRLVFRIPGVALVGVLFAFLSFSVVALAGPPVLLSVYLIPIALGVWVVRTRTIVEAEAIRVRGLVGTRRIDWSELAGLQVREKKWVRAVLQDGNRVMLPCVKPRHLPVLALLSGGRLPDPTEAGRGNDEAPTSPAEIATETGANV
ncbi:MAG TPA: PH domain-containing protein [Pseudonocardiaceae bacterium]|nr:PH domain-containing protein [Pseudonocardiaceae bacterium]